MKRSELRLTVILTDHRAAFYFVHSFFEVNVNTDSIASRLRVMHNTAFTELKLKTYVV